MHKELRQSAENNRCQHVDNHFQRTLICPLYTLKVKLKGVKLQQSNSCKHREMPDKMYNLLTGLWGRTSAGLRDAHVWRHGPPDSTLKPHSSSKLPPPPGDPSEAPGLSPTGLQTRLGNCGRQQPGSPSHHMKSSGC